MEFWVQRIQCLTYLKLWKSYTHNSKIKEIIIFCFCRTTKNLLLFCVKRVPSKYETPIVQIFTCHRKR